MILMAKKNNRYVPLKNYVIALLLCVFAILLTLYIFSWIHVYQENRYSKSYLLTSKTISLEVNDLEEVESTFTEAPNEYFVFISYRGNEEVYRLEKSLKKIIDKYKLNDIFYYIDITELMDKEDFFSKLNGVLSLDNSIQNVPTILYFKDGSLAKSGVVSREDEKIIEAGDFEKLLDMYEFKVSN